MNLLADAALAVMAAIPIVTTGVLYARALPLESTATTIAASTAAIVDSAHAMGPTPVTRSIHEENWISWLQCP